jgi:Tfp pilus assembly protein PilV
MIEKIVLIAALVFGIATLAAGGYIAYQSGQLSKYKQKYAEAEAHSMKADLAITRQNALIEAYKLDIAAAKETVRVETKVITEYAEVEKEKVVTRLIKDNSCEERLAIINEQLEAFWSAL